VDTLMIPDILAEDDSFTPRSHPRTIAVVTPLICAHVAMHGEFKLNMNSRLTLERPALP